MFRGAFTLFINFFDYLSKTKFRLLTDL